MAMLVFPSDADKAYDTRGETRMTSSILVIDDDAGIRLLCRMNLERGDVTVTEAASGAEGLEAARGDVPALIVLDLMMSQMDGVEVLRRLKEDPVTEGIPVLILTAKASGYERDRCTTLGAAAFMTKPFSMQELADTVDALMRESSPATRP
jgi:CheY-like chemotaxis protein